MGMLGEARREWQHQHEEMRASSAALEVAAAEHSDESDVVRGEVVEAGYATVLVARDPDGIAIEFFAPAAS